MQGRTDIADVLAGMALFADLSAPKIQEIAHTFEEEMFEEGRRVLRQGLSGGSFYVILEGDASVVHDGTTVDRLARGDFFGELSIFLEEPPTADVVALSALRCAVLPGHELDGFLRAHPSVAVRMLRTEARRLRDTTRRHS